MILNILNEVIDVPSTSALLSNPRYNHKRLLLTSNGFENPRIGKFFLDTINIQPNKIRVLFIATAAISNEDKLILKECYNELYNLGILEKNINTYTDLSYLTIKDISSNYDCIYVAGGDENYLLNHINRSGFRNTLLSCIKDYNKYYIGVSAGSYICGSNMSNNLGIISNPIDVHCKDNIVNNGIVKDTLLPLNLSSIQAIWINGDTIKVIS